MTKKLHTHHGLGLLALAIIATSSMGCRSSNFSLPKMKMFSWNRQPDAATLAGNTQPAGLPESPAAKYDPAAIASTAGKSTTTGTTAGMGSAYGYGATGATPGLSPQPGLAASANGYQTGPYQLAPKTPTTSSTVVASTATAGSLPAGSLASPYGGTYSGSTANLNSNPYTSTAAKSDVPLPSSVTAALAQGTASTPGVAAGGGFPALPSATMGSSSLGTPALPAGYVNNGSGQTPASTSAYQMMPSPPAYPTSNPYSPGTTTGSLGGVATGGSYNPGSSASTAPATSSAPGLPGYPNSNTPSGNSPLTNLATPPSTTSSAYQGATTLSTYSPGSTGRSTSYDFSSSSGKSSAGASSAAATLPTGGTNNATQPLLR